MKKTKASTKNYDIDELVYYEHALYEHDHKENRMKDYTKNTKVDIHDYSDEGAMKVLLSGILYN